MNPLIELHRQGQSFWLDFIKRSLLTSGELKESVEKKGLRGITSNPTIFQKAIASGSGYDEAIKKAMKTKKTAKDIFDEIAVQDIQGAADVLKTVYRDSGGGDGYISLEVNPTLAFRTEDTLKEAKRLWGLVKRPNLMIKIPGTDQGLPAIEEATFSGINVNITLLFSVDLYKKVVDAYLKGLERRVKKGLPVKHIHSVASFFVSRVDKLVDKRLDAIIEAGGDNAGKANSILHRIAIANAKIAYEHYEKVFHSRRFLRLKKKSANTQRLLWASTSTKDKRMSDVVYVEELIGPDTVNTMPPDTAEAFADHGKIETTLTKDLDQAKADLLTLASLGVSLEEATKKLQKDGVQSFIYSFDDLLRVVNAKREILSGELEKAMTISLPGLEAEYEETVRKIKEDHWVSRIWSKDAGLWKDEDAHRKIIWNSLGWLTAMDAVRSQKPMIDEIVRSVKKGKFTHILLLGMGGSSLCPEVLRMTFGKKPGFPDFAILDSTEPASVLERRKWSKPEKTLYIVASKSGSTTEPNAFLAYFFEEVRKRKKTKAGENFIAITDPGTVLEATAKRKKFRHVVLNQPDIGGRYSGLSFFGMVPAALMGIDVMAVLESASRMAGACDPAVPVEKNPGVRLGAALGTAAKAGRNKATFFLSKDLASFGTWAEQLLAESTGKEGAGILPIESEPLQKPAVYRDDRFFVHIRTASSKDKPLESKLKELNKAGHPLVEIVLNDKRDIGGEFFRWEFATAVAGGLLGINPFDQPNVQEAKDLTKRFIDDYKSNGRFSSEPPVYEDDRIVVYASNGHGPAASVEEAVRRFLAEAGDGDYLALLAYLTRDKKNEKILQDLRQTLLQSLKRATTVGFGPRYLHSTGQYHKGGDNNGLFLSLTAFDRKDLRIPGDSITYAVLKEAQARGDWEALKKKGRRVLHFHLKKPKEGFDLLKKSVSHLSRN